MLFLPTAALILATSASATSVRTRLAFWVEGPVNGGCNGWGMPFPGFSTAAKAKPSCWNNTLTSIMQHAALIDELQLSVGFLVTNVSNGLIDLDRDGSAYAPGFRERPLDWLPHWIPDLRAVLKPETKIMASLDFGGGAFGNTTAVASQVYANAKGLAVQMLHLATTYDWIDGYTIDYEAYCTDVPQEAARLGQLFETLSTELHGHGKALNFCTNQNGAGFEHWPYYQSYLDAGIDRLYDMGTYSKYTHTGKSTDHREQSTNNLLKYPLNSTAFGLGDYRPFDTAAETRTWLDELLLRSQGRPGQLMLHVYDLFGAKPAIPGHDCATNRTEFDHHCVRPPESWWPALEHFHA